MTEFVEAPGGNIFVEGHDHDPAQLRTDLAAYVKSWGLDPFETDHIIAGVRFERTWYTEVGGFHHDCTQHLLEETTDLCRAARPVVAVCRLVRPA